jgi:hypothetical protein
VAIQQASLQILLGQQWKNEKEIRNQSFDITVKFKLSQLFGTQKYQNVKKV